MATFIDKFLKSDYLDLTAHEALKRSPVVLLGVTDTAAGVLDRLGIKTIFDLACSSIFSNARKLVEAANGPADGLSKLWPAPGDMVDQSVRFVPVAELKLKSIKALNSIGDETAEKL